jgi:hypothetical protein
LLSGIIDDSMNSRAGECFVVQESGLVFKVIKKMVQGNFISLEKDDCRLFKYGGSLTNGIYHCLFEVLL